jgi:D-alanyl-D-alanine carboxypeptidase/D-alanyl-D-alanine-endopeptidase (penicillin-binding protein 4)
VRRWLVPAVLAVVSVGGAVSAALDATAAVPTAPAVAAAPPLAPVLSPRRVPEALAHEVAEARLRTDLDRVVAARQQSCLVVSGGGRTLYSLRPDERLVPASNLKLLTATAVLEKLGPQSRLTTEVRSVATVRDGVLDGDLWLVGGGDPLLGTADYAASHRNQPQLFTPLEQLADRVKAAGVTTVTGAVRGDESRYDTQRYIPTWRPTYVVDAEVGPASALTVDDGYVQWKPKHIAAPAPATHAAGRFTSLLQQRGVTVTGGVGEGTAPKSARPFVSLDSAPMREIVAEMLRESDNLTAELLVKELGARFARAGTTAAGLRVVRDTLAGLGLPVDHVTAVDGSGLDRGDRASCTVVMAVLRKAGEDSPIGTGVPVAGRDGTLSQRFQGHPAAGRLRAKTGSLDNVVGLSGWVDPAAGDDAPLTFAFLANDVPREAAGRALQEAVAAVLARYPDAPAPSELEP